MVGVDADFFLFGFEGVAANVDKEGVYFSFVRLRGKITFLIAGF